MSQTVSVGNDTLEFPDEMSDTEIKAAIDKHYGGAKRPEAFKEIPIGASYKGVSASIQRSLDNPNPTDAQKAAVTGLQNSEEYDASAEKGSSPNPIVQGPVPVPVSASYIDPQGAQHSNNPGKADEGLGFAYGLKHPIDNMAIWLDKVPALRSIDELSHKYLGTATADQAAAATQADIDKAAAEGRRPGALGQFGGNVLAGIPITAITKNPWLAGAMIGGANTKDPNSATGTAVDTATGSIFGGVGDIALRGIGSAIAPRLNPLVQKLINEGVELTPGQTLGGMAHRLEDATRSIYGLGDLVIGAQNRANDSLNRVAVQRTLSPLGVEIPKNIPEGHAQIGFAQKTLGDAYDAVLADIDKRSPQTGTTMPVPAGTVTPGGLHLDAQFGAEVGNLRKLAQGLPADQAHVFESFVQGELKHGFNPNGSISADQMKKVDELLGQKVRNFRSSSNPHDRDMANAFQELQGQLREMVGRQFPQHAATLDAINNGYAQLTRLEPVAAQAPGGKFTPNQLKAGVVAADKSTRHRTSARGEAMMQDLSDAAQQVMHSTVPDSGTPARALATGLAGYALFGNPMHGIHVNPWAAATLGAASLPYVNRTAGNVARAMISERPAAASAVRAAVESTKPAVVAGAATHQDRARAKQTKVYQ